MLAGHGGKIGRTQYFDIASVCTQATCPPWIMVLVFVVSYLLPWRFAHSRGGPALHLQCQHLFGGHVMSKHSQGLCDLLPPSVVAIRVTSLSSSASEFGGSVHRGPATGLAEADTRRHLLGERSYAVCWSRRGFELKVLFLEERDSAMARAVCEVTSTEENCGVALGVFRARPRQALDGKSAARPG